MDPDRTGSGSVAFIDFFFYTREVEEALPHLDNPRLLSEVKLALMHCPKSNLNLRIKTEPVMERVQRCTRT